MPAGVDPQFARALGRAIARARKARGMTQEELRRRVGNSKNAVSNWERGVSAPTVQNLRELCRALGVPPEQLLGLDRTRRRKQRDQPSADARELAKRLTTLRRQAERAAPDLIGALRNAEREARRLGGVD